MGFENIGQDGDEIVDAVLFLISLQAYIEVIFAGPLKVVGPERKEI